MVVVFQCLLKSSITPAIFIFNFPAADPPQHGQQPHWPAPQGGWHQVTSFCWHGSSTQGACYTASIWFKSVVAKQPKTILLKEFWLLTSLLHFNLEILSVWSASRSKRRAAHKIKLGNTSERRKLVYRDAPFILMLEFSQIKTGYTLWKNSLVKIRLDLNNNLYLSTFRSHDLFQDRLLSHWTR